MEDRVGREGAVGCGGRGNLRENREDPAPTVGIGGDSIAIQMPLPPPCADHATQGYPRLL